ncbi:MAG: caspase family protein [Candidatus Promineifilaceae bacterium]|nr:caspase family protein [Candidatus Promineifilaceae bacterium]
MSKTFVHGYAVVIGVDENQIKRLALPAVAKDVTAVYEVLIHPERCAYDKENVRLVNGSEATGKNILEAFLWLKEKAKQDPEATAVIYYSGHGMRDKKTDRYYLIPYDIESLARVRVSALKAEEIQASISEIRAKRTLIILDCCHASGMDVKDIDPDEPELDAVAFPELPETKEVPAYEEGRKDVSELAEGEGRAILNSSTGPESSYVRPDRKMSVFTYHLIEALTGHAPHDDDDTVVYVTDVMSWVTKKVKQTAAEINKSQTPVMRTDGVFPVAQLIGGQGLPLGKGVEAPDPLAPLPTVNTGGGDFAGRDMTQKEGGVHFEGGDVDIAGPVVGGSVNELVMGNKTEHSEVIQGDKIGGDKVGGDKISVGSVSGGVVSIGRESQAIGSTVKSGGENRPELTELFKPLYQTVAAEGPQTMPIVISLQGEVEKGKTADDQKIAGAIMDVADAVPAARPIMKALFQDPQIASFVQDLQMTQFALMRLG